MYTRDTVITVLPFSQQRQGEDIVIGRVDTGVFLAIPPDAVEILEELAAGKNIGEVSDSYQRKYGAVPDLDDFLDLLEAKGIVNSASIAAESKPQVRERLPATRKIRYHFAGFPESIARRLFGKPVLAASLLLVLYAVRLCVQHPSLVPRTADLYFPDHQTLSWVILLAAGYVTLFAHEMAHLIAARALGISSRLGISHRLWYLVAETDLTGLWSVPKAKRFLPLLAGMILDATSGSLLIVVVFSVSSHWIALPVFLVRVMKAMAFVYLMRMAWQCLLYMRTDLYYVIAGCFNCKSLMRDTETYLQNQIAKVLPKKHTVDQSAIPPAERRIIRIYSLIWIAGRIEAVVLLGVVTIPLAIQYFHSLGGVFRIGYAANPSNFIDALLLATYFLVPTVAGFTLWIRSIVQRERASQ
jgi:putative peptide zinc metalloprotease protein